jgi:hypothetical protein
MFRMTHIGRLPHPRSALAGVVQDAKTLLLQVWLAKMHVILPLIHSLPSEIIEQKRGSKNVDAAAGGCVASLLSL